MTSQDGRGQVFEGIAEHLSTKDHKTEIRALQSDIRAIRLSWHFHRSNRAADAVLCGYL